MSTTLTENQETTTARGNNRRPAGNGSAQSRRSPAINRSTESTRRGEPLPGEDEPLPMADATTNATQAEYDKAVKRMDDEIAQMKSLISPVRYADNPAEVEKLIKDGTIKLQNNVLIVPLSELDKVGISWGTILGACYLPVRQRTDEKGQNYNMRTRPYSGSTILSPTGKQDARLVLSVIGRHAEARMVYTLFAPSQAAPKLQYKSQISVWIHDNGEVGVEPEISYGIRAQSMRGSNLWDEANNAIFIARQLGLPVLHNTDGFFPSLEAHRKHRKDAFEKAKKEREEREGGSLPNINTEDSDPDEVFANQR